MVTESALSMRVSVWRGGDAWARLESRAFREEWDRLYADCPWGSVFQSYAYAATWYRVYRPRFTPLLVAALGSEGRLTGLLPLALDLRGQPVAAGDRQAEYQVWLARVGYGDRFIEAALEHLAAEYPGRTLTLRYLPANTPRGWLASRRGVVTRCVLRAARRGVMEISQTSAEARLRTKKNRERLRRLQELGPVTFNRLTDPLEVDALLDEIIPLCDLRHGALHGVLPFADDLLKAPFHRALARVPGVLYVSALRCGGELVAAGFDADNRGQIALGFAGFSPAFARHSPRRAHLVMLARDSSRRGYTSIDLTPGDDAFKEDYATRFEEAYTLHVASSASRSLTQAAIHATRRTARTLIEHVGADPARLLQRLSQVSEALTSAGARRALPFAVRALRRRLWSEEAVDLYRLGRDAVDARPVSASLHRDCISDLTAYRPGVFAAEPRRAFLRTALKRLERGAHAFTRVADGRLAACGWVSGPAAANNQAVFPGALRWPSDAAITYGVMTSGRLSTPDELASILKQLVHAAAELPDVGQVLIAVPRLQRELRQAAEHLGGSYAGRISWRTRGGMTQVTSTFVATIAAPGPVTTSANVPSASAT